MKKFFRLVSMFALAGATLAYTGCTDYDEDIDKINDRIDALETGRLKTVEEQVASLQTTVTGLQAAQKSAEENIAKLQSSLSDLKSAHDADIKRLDAEYKAADEALKSSIEAKINSLKSDYEAKVSEIETTIGLLQNSVSGLEAQVDEINKTLPTLATKKDFEAHVLASAEAFEKANEEIGKLSAALEIANKSIADLSEKLGKTVEELEAKDAELAEGIKEALDAVKKAQESADEAMVAANNAQTAADKAQETASEGLGKVNALIEALGEYAKKGALEAKIEALEKMDETLDSKKFNTADFYDTFTTHFTNAIKAAVADDGVVGEVVIAKVNAAKSELNERIDDVETALNARIDKVLGTIEGRLTSIAFVPEYYIGGVPAFIFENIAYNAVPAGKVGENVNPDEKAVVDDPNSLKYFAAANTTAKYRLNPKTVGVECADFSFVGEKALYLTKAVAPAAPVEIVGVPSYDKTTGYAVFTVAKTEKINTTEKMDIVSLKAVLKKGLTENEIKAGEKPEVYSEYVHVNETNYFASQLAIADSYKLDSKTDPVGLVRGDFMFVNGHEYAKTVSAAQEGKVVYQMPYDKPFDLKALVATCFSNGDSHAALDLAKYGFSYKFAVAETPYVVASDETKTNQQTVIECVDGENGIFETISAKGEDHNKEAVGRTPIVKIDLVDANGNIVTHAFVKLLISVEKEANIRVADDVLALKLACPETAVSREISEETMREAVYRVLNISHEEFWNVYEYDAAAVTKNGEAASITAPELLDGVASDGKATKKVVWNFTHGEVKTIGSTAKVVATLTVKNKLFASELPAEISFVFEVDFTLPEPVVKAEVNDIFWKNDVLQANVNRPESISDVAENCYFSTPIAEQPWKVLTVEGLPCNETPDFRISHLFNINNDGKTVDWKSTSGVNLVKENGEVYITLDKSNDKVKAALNSLNGLQAEVQWYAKAESGDEFVLKTFVVNFIRPLNFTLPDGLEVQDAKTGGDEVAFQDKAMLTDWRGEVVFAPEFKNAILTDYYWNKVCSPADHAVWVPAQQIVKTPAKVEVETAEIKIGEGETVFTASYQLKKNQELMNIYEESGEVAAGLALIAGKGSWEVEQTVTATGRSENEAKQNAEAKINKMDEHYLCGFERCGRNAEYLGATSEVVGSDMTITVVTGVKYTPAKYVMIPGHFVLSPCNLKPGPSSVDVYTEGQRIGCWEYQKYQYSNVVTVSGQYWDFYGPIGDVVLDTENVYTDLSDAKLPAGAVLQQIGNTVKYENVMSPIQYSYNIFIPATITYGWGTLNETLTIKVNPVVK